MLLTRRDSVMGETTPRRTRRPKQPRIPGDFAALVLGMLGKVAREHDAPVSQPQMVSYQAKVA